MYCTVFRAIASHEKWYGYPGWIKASVAINQKEVRRLAPHEFFETYRLKYRYQLFLCKIIQFCKYS